MNNIESTILTSLEPPVQYSGTSQSVLTPRHKVPCFLNCEKNKVTDCEMIFPERVGWRTSFPEEDVSGLSHCVQPVKKENK